MRTFPFVVFVVVHLLVVQSTIGAEASQFEGFWQGTFNGQPMGRDQGGNFAESVTSFELRLRRAGVIIKGDFQKLAKQNSLRMPIKNGKFFGERICFDVLDSQGDMRWCVAARNDDLIGAWTQGPEGGPMLDGNGIGARFFAINAKRVRKN